MQLALSAPSVPPFVPVWAELSGNLRQGFATKNQAWNPGPNVVNSTTAIGFLPSLFLEAVRQSHRARYYNPATGRFMSRDPENGILKDPASLHKYLYANGDPADLIDPAGRAPMLETGELEERTLPELEEGAFRLGKLLLKYNQCAAFVIADAAWIVTGNWASAATGTLLFFTCLAQAGG